MKAKTKKIVSLLSPPALISALLMAGICLLPTLVLGTAEGLNFNLDMGTQISTESSLRPFYDSVLQYILIAAGSVVVLFLIIGGIQYLTSHGNSQLEEAGKRTVTNAIVGGIVILLALIIIRTVEFMLEGRRPF